MGMALPAAIVFDWGDTLMTTFPEYDGAMVDWPRVAAEAGAAEALEELSGRWRLLVGTNAANSSAAQVGAALQRAGLGGFIERVFTVHELGSRKPEPGFYRALQEQTGLAAHQLVMVGDDYPVDVAGAWQTGWQTVWYNRSGRAAPGLQPLHDREVTHLSALPAALEAPALPGYGESTAWLLQHGASAGLLAHVQTVAALAYQMAVWLRAAGQPVDTLLAHRGGLLHDLAKLWRAPSGERGDHGARAAALLESRGQPALAQIARRHMLHQVLDAEFAPRTWEEKLVYFADKLVEGSRVATVEERLNSLRQRYPQHVQTTNAAAPLILRMQEELCAVMGFPVEELHGRLVAAMRGEG